MKFGWDDAAKIAAPVLGLAAGINDVVFKLS